MVLVQAIPKDLAHANSSNYSCLGSVDQPYLYSFLWIEKSENLLLNILHGDMMNEWCLLRELTTGSTMSLWSFRFEMVAILQAQYLFHKKTFRGRGADASYTDSTVFVSIALHAWGNPLRCVEARRNDGNNHRTDIFLITMLNLRDSISTKSHSPRGFLGQFEARWPFSPQTKHWANGSDSPCCE